MSTETPSRPSWTPGSGPDRKCQNCEAHHTKEYIRHFGQNGRLEHCHKCLTHRDMQVGAGRMPDYDPAIHRRRHSVSDKNPLFHGVSDDE